MYKLCLLLACLACAGDGRRIKAIVDQQFSGGDAKGQKVVKQLNSTAGSRSHGQANRSGSGQFAGNMANPVKFIPILLTFFSPSVVIAPSSTGEVEGPTVRIVVTVDWEGSNLREENLNFFKDFREAHPEVPLTHFLNAAYFAKSEVQSIHEYSPSQVLSPIDEHGLAIHGWKSLVESSGVPYRSEPSTLLGPEELELSLQVEEGLKASLELHSSDLDSSAVNSSGQSQWLSSEEKTALENHLRNHLSRDVGYDVDIRAYNVNELRSMISNSKALLEKQGLKVGKSFRVGTRLAGANVLEAFRREGFRVNSSAVGLDDMMAKMSPESKEVWSDAPLSAMLRELWPDITKDSQPFLLETPAGWVLEMPDAGGGGSADFATEEDMVEHVDSAVQQLESEDRFVLLGFHQESAATYGPRIIAAITEIKHKHGNRVVFETLESSARRTMTVQQLKEMESTSEPDVAQKS